MRYLTLISHDLNLRVHFAKEILFWEYGSLSQFYSLKNGNIGNKNLFILKIATHNDFFSEFYFPFSHQIFSEAGLHKQTIYSCRSSKLPWRL